MLLQDKLLTVSSTMEQINHTRRKGPSRVLKEREIGPVERPNENDVLCGRGGGTKMYSGNRQFLDIVGIHSEEYIRTKKAEKIRFAENIVREVRQLSPPGRFLKEDPVSGMWYDIGDWKAIRKAGQTLRDVVNKHGELAATANNNIEAPSRKYRIHQEPSAAQDVANEDRRRVGSSVDIDPVPLEEIIRESTASRSIATSYSAQENTKRQVSVPAETSQQNATVNSYYNKQGGHRQEHERYEHQQDHYQRQPNYAQGLQNRAAGRSRSHYENEALTHSEQISHQRIRQHYEHQQRQHPVLQHRQERREVEAEFSAKQLHSKKVARLGSSNMYRWDLPRLGSSNMYGTVVGPAGTDNLPASNDDNNYPASNSVTTSFSSPTGILSNVRKTNRQTSSSPAKEKANDFTKEEDSSSNSERKGHYQ